MSLSKDIIKGIEAMGFEELSPIQKEAIPVILEGKDIIGQAQTGTGKTAAFGIPMLEKVDTKSKKVQQIVLCPTRELSIQVAREIGNLGRFKKGLYVLPIYGGQPISRQIKSLNRGVQIVVATPGRLMDHIRRKTLKLDGVNMMVLDEADEMFDMGFRDDIKFVMDQLTRERQTIFFSATMARDITNFAKRYQDKPEIIKVAHRELTMPNIDQYYLNVNEHQKIDVLSRLIDIDNPRLALIFANTKRKVDAIKGSLQSRGYFVDSLHGDLNQNQRDRVMDKFRKGNIDILVATDVAARGIDVDEIDVVFNYDIPHDDEYYVHRIGRTARAGRDGKAYSFATNRDRNRIRTIERYAKTKIERMSIPTRADVAELKEEVALEGLKTMLEKDVSNDHKKLLDSLIDAGHTPYNIAASLLTIYMDKANASVETPATRAPKQAERSRKSPDNKRGRSSGGKGRIYINTGSKNGIAPRHILAAIIEASGITQDQVGSIDIFDKFTFVDIDQDVLEQVISRTNNTKINNKNVLVEEANSRK